MQSDQNRKKNWRKCVSGLQKCFIFIVFSIYQSIYMHGDKDKDIRSWIHWDWYHIHSLLFWQPFQTYKDINTICTNVNKMQSSLVFANSFTVMYKSVCLCFLYDLKHLLLSACRLTTISDWCANVMHYNISLFQMKIDWSSALLIIDIYMSVSFYCAKVATCKHACS